MTRIKTYYCSKTLDDAIVSQLMKRCENVKYKKCYIPTTFENINKIAVKRMITNEIIHENKYVKVLSHKSPINGSITLA